MKKDIHPTYYPKAKIICACGNSMTVGTTTEEIHIDICSQCHPFYTGKQKLIDAARRVEKFQTRTSQQVATAATRKGRKAKIAKGVARKKKTKIEEA